MSHTGLRIVLQAAKKVGAEIPKPFIKDQAKLDAIAVGIEQLRERESSLASAVVDAFEAGTDPLTDPAVIGAVVKQAMVAGQFGADAEIRRHTDKTIRQHTASLLGMFAKPFDEAAATLVSAHEVLGDVALANVAHVATKGGDAGRAWAEAHNAEQTIAQVLNVWPQAARLAGWNRWDRTYSLLAVAEVPPEVWIAERLRHTKVSPWDIVRRGWPLRLATIEQFETAVKATSVEAERAEAARASASRDAMAMPHRFKVS